ncbi:hypothetical protein ACJRO7_026337 [Eucalyptus globulus]|uniref:AAA+ ATPase domain-containing protein n=1 Tax=Eucalyptus globulus TaxID=34317 RepID=A0ABD3JNR5_EUCGL
MSLDSPVAVAWDVLKMVVIPIKHQFGYVISSKSYVQDLQKEVGKLTYEAERIHNAAEVARNNLQKVYNLVTKWHESAEQALKEARGLLRDFDEASKTCCYDTLPNPNCRYQFSKKAKHMIKGIQRLAREGSEFRDISFSDPAPGIVDPPTSVGREGKDVVQSTTAMASTSCASTLIKLKDDGVFGSRASIIQDIMDALADSSNSVVGVYGMGGVGKSTLLVDAERRIKEETLFGLVTKADVSANPDIKRIQEEIAHELGLDFKNQEFVSVRAKLLCERLQAEGKKKKVLIVLDNLWERLDLKSVGIPCGHDNKVIGCKLLLTSRDRNVLQREMGCDRDFLLLELQEEEARGLFERLAGDKVHDDKFKPLVDEALHNCAGFPFLIIAMAKYFKNSHFSDLKDALKQIDMSTNKGISKVINEMLQLSYDHLKGEEGEDAKSLLRLCVACGVSKPHLEDLVRYGVGLRLFQEYSRMEDARHRLSSLIHTLQASSLLSDDEDANGFKIHDLVRGFVASVASRDHPFLVLKDENKSVAELSKDKLKSCKAICFGNVNLEELPKELDCPELQMFLLLTFRSDKSREVPDSYFNSMRYLMVLELSGIHLSHSPSPFQFLENLHTLCLNFCSLENVAILGELKGLQILSFISSNIHRLPKEIGQLVELRLLDLSYCSQLEIIEPGVLRNLIKLEELYMENSFHQWNDGEQTPPTNASLIELNNMKNLCTLHISIHNPRLLPEDLNFKQLTKYKIQIGNQQRWSKHWNKYEGSRTLDLKLDPISNILEKRCIQSILHKIDTLFLDGLNKTKQSICALSREGFPKLKHLEVKNSPSIQNILQWPSLIAFKTLESLHLENLINFEKISNNNISSESFNALKVVRVGNCDKMEVLFPLSMARQLPQLEEIKVVHCKLMRGIVEVDDRGKVELCNLRVLKLCHLPYIKYFSSVGLAPTSSTSDDQVSTQIAFFNGKQVSIPSLESLTVEGLPNMQEIWSDESPLELSNLQSLVVVQCKSLSKVIGLRSLLKLHKLHTLTIKDCDLVQEIFDLDGPSGSGNVVALFELTTLELSKMRSLRHIWNKNPCGIVSLHSLKKLVVEDCDNLRFMFFRSIIKSLAHLRDLTVSNCQKMEAVIMEEEGVGMEIIETLEFPMLTDLRLKRLESLMCFSCGKCSRETWSQDHVQSRFTALFNREVSIPSLKSLTMEGLPNMQEIWSDESPLELSNLQSLVVVQCKSLLKVIGLRSLLKLHKLHTLTIKDCDLVQDIFDLDGPSGSGNVVALFELTTLELSKMRSLRHIWNKNLSGIVSLHNLKKLVVKDCANLRFIFFPSTIKSLAHLRDLTISNCKKMEAIIMEEEGVGMEIVETLEFPMLTNLHLKRLERLMCFSHGKCSRETWSQDHVQSRFMALFNREVSIPSLESLTVEGLPNMQEIWSDESPLELSNLQSLVVVQCKSLSKVISLRSLLKLHKLHTLTIKNCVSVQEIFDLDGPSGSGNVVALFELTTLELSKMRSLRYIWNKNPCGIVSMHNLKKLVVEECDNLEFMFFRSIIKSLANLRDLTVSNCQKMEVVIMEEEGVGMEIIEILEFSMLTNLCLDRLESLMCFSHGKCSQEAWSRDRVQSCFTVLFNQEVAFPRLETLEIFGIYNFRFIFFPSMVKSFAQLKKLSVWYCEKMEAIIMEEEGLGMERSETLAFPMLTDLKLYSLGSLTCFSHKKYSREVQTQDCIKSHSTTLFNEEVAFPRLETLNINGIDNIKKIWDNQVAVDSFHNLKYVCVKQCHKLVNLVPSCILGRLLSLEGLKAQDCGSLEAVFELRPLNRPDRHPTSCFPLKQLELFELPKLKCVWDKELHYQDKFQCLRSICISRCESLTSLFPTSVAKYIIQLEDLEIDDCGITELIEKEEGLVPQFVFPKLTSLKLKHLTELKCIYIGTHALRWPALKTLEVHGCNKVEIFALQLENEMSFDKQPLFLIEKGTFPNLQELKLDLSKQMEIWHGHSHDEEFFCKLRVLELHYLSKESPMSIYHFIESLTNLEKLVICESYPEEPSINEVAIEGTSQELKVTLPFLGHIRHLQTLYMSHCDGLSNLFTPTITENLVALTKLRISNCKILTEVISDEDGEEVRAVAFNQLKYMELDGLTKLRCFSSGGHTLIFPLLEDVIVNGCPNMKFFSRGPIEMLKLERVQVDLKKLYEPTKYGYFWEGNLNITLENMCKEMATVVGIKFLWLFEFPELIRKWHSELNPIKSSWQLKTLMVDKCPSFINAIPSKLMLALEEMRSLQVGDCESLEEIFDLEGLDVVESTHVLPQLCYINLINLPKLRQLWNKDLQGMMCFNTLYSLTLYKCSNLRHAFVPSMARCLANLQWMEIKECGQMEGVIVDEEGPGSAMEITFWNLWGIQLECLPNLTSFLLGKNHMLNCPMMEDLTIAHCPKMRSLTWQALAGIDNGTPSLFTPQVQFPQLESMVLSHMDNLSNIWTNSPQETLMFDCLREVNAQNCKSLENLFPHWVATSLTQLVRLQVESCGIDKIVSSGDDTPHSDIAQVLFPKLTFLLLHDMPQLQSFCPNLPTLNWPFLKELYVTHCGDKLNMLSFATSMNIWAQRDDQHDLSDQEAHHSFERDFPMLERLLLVDKNIQMIQDGKFPEDFFGKPKALTLACFHDEKAIFPLRFLLERFQYLQSLEVFCSSFEDIFLDEGLVDEGKHSMLENLTKLKLRKLHNLKSVWRENSLVSKIVRRIKTFEVWDCPYLTTIFPAVTSFQNLTKLEVKNSSGLVHLATTSMAINLVNLTSMTIIGCERMKEVVANDGNIEGKVISFGKLEWLLLQHLPSLECFSSIPNCIFRFPLLSNIRVEECLRMKTFSKGILSTPKLNWMTLFRYEWRFGDWKEGDDLNTTIQKLSA